MSARVRVLTVVAAAAVLAVAGTVTIAWLQARGESTQQPGTVSKPRAGVPPLTFDFGVRSDPESVALTRGETLLGKGKRQAALAIFSRYHSVDAQIGAAFARWPADGLDTLKHLVASHPGSAAAQLHLGWALLWSGRVSDAAAQLQRVDSRFPDAPESVIAENVLYSKMNRDLPFLFLGLTASPAASPAEQVRLLERRAEHGDADAKLRYGLALWTLRRRVSAERQFSAAASLAPEDPVARTAAAVGTFTKRNPVKAFSRLGPLTGVFPRAAVVRLHLGILLLWTGQVAKGEQQLRIAVSDEPRSRWAKAAGALLGAIPKTGTK